MNFLQFRLKVQGDGIDTPALTRRCRAVIKDVPKMGMTISALNLYPVHVVGKIINEFYVLGFDDIKKTRPPAPRFEFGF